MNAISTPNRITYDCNVFKYRPHVPAISEIVPESRNWILTESRENKILMIASILGPF